MYNDGHIWHSRRLLVEVNCPSFNFGQVPFDTQYCFITLGVYRYTDAEVELNWKNTADENGGVDMTPSGGNSVASGEWSISITEVREAVKVYHAAEKHTVYRYAQACIKFERHSVYFVTIMVISVLLVFANYSGLFVAAGAAPARVALAFLSFLMVLNNLNALNNRLPPLNSQKDRVWLKDFLLGTTFFNFSLLIEYACVSYSQGKLRRARSEREYGVSARI